VLPVSYCLHTGFGPQSAGRVPLTMPILCFCTRLYDVSRFGLVRRRQSLDLSPMNRDDASDFRPSPGCTRDRGRAGGRRSQSFVAQVMKAAAKANGGPLTQARLSGGKRRGGSAGKGRCSRIGRGQAVADTLKRQAAERSPDQRQRRVVVKARIVRHRAGSGAAGAHLRYIQRDGTTRDGEHGRLYGPERDQEDGKAFVERGEGDRHSFRFIVAPEDGDRLSDLRGFTRDVMSQMETDLGTKLDWVAVDHYNTTATSSSGARTISAGDRVALIVDGVDGRTHHVALGKKAVAQDSPTGSIVEIGRAPVGPRASDRNIAAMAAAAGVYRPSEHRAMAEAGHVRVPGGDFDGYIESHVRRLEALRRAGIVERLDADRWSIPSDYEARATAYDTAQSRRMNLRLLSAYDLDRQITSDGATWLDRELVSPNRTPLTHAGFGSEVSRALERRKDSLVERGFASRLPEGGLRVPRDLLSRLEQREIARVGPDMAKARGLAFRPAEAGKHVSGTLVGATNLASGKFAVIDDGLGFSLVPWQPMLEQRLGRQIAGVAMPGGGIDWTFGRSRGLSL
jgi:hypothetical protein